MRPLSYRPDELRSLLMRTKIATLDELKQALGTSIDVTVFRKLKPLGYLTSYSHRGRYYTLREIARFDEKGLWSQADGLVLATRHLAVNGGVICQSFSARVFRRRTCWRLACRCAGRAASTDATTPGDPSDGFRFVFVYGHRSHNPARPASDAPQCGGCSHGCGCLRVGSLRRRIESIYSLVLQSAG